MKRRLTLVFMAILFVPVIPISGQTVVRYTYGQGGNRATRVTEVTDTTNNQSDQPDIGFHDDPDDGITQPSELTITVSPNPFTETVLVNSSGGGSVVRHEIFSSSGVILYRKDNVASIAEINLSLLPSGVYFLVVTSDKGSSTTKLIKK